MSSAGNHAVAGMGGKSCSVLANADTMSQTSAEKKIHDWFEFLAHVWPENKYFTLIGLQNFTRTSFVNQLPSSVKENKQIQYNLGIKLHIHVPFKHY